MECAVLGRDDHRHAVHHLNHFGIADPVGGKDDHFVLWVDDGVEKVEERLLRPLGDDDVLRRGDAAVIVFGVSDDRFFQ